MTIHEKYMLRCIELAKLGAGNVAPNPLVGAVLVHDEKIISEGYHQKYGEAHAEVNCISNVSEENKKLISSSTLYVSLEPCSHFGKTPPCADFIIKQKIKKVVIGCKDSFTKVDGKGIEKLKAANIDVEVGVLENECRELNKRFFTFHEKQRPYIILKWAQTADKKIAYNNDERLLITNEFTNRIVHKWRSEESAILIGTNTALKDDSLLTARLWKGNNPIRLIIDMNLRLPKTLKIFNKEAQTIIFNYKKNAHENNVYWIKINPTNNIVEEILTVCFERNIQSILVEGGAKILQAFIDADFYDEVRIITNEELEIKKGVDAPINYVMEKSKNISYFADRIDILNDRICC